MADPDKAPSVGIVLASGLALAVGGGIAYTVGREDEAKREELQTELGKTRDKDTRDSLTAQSADLDFKSGIELGAGGMASTMGSVLLVAGLGTLVGLNFRKALAWVGTVPLLLASYFAVFHVGTEALVPVTLLGVAFFLYLTWYSDKRGRRAAAQFAQFPSRVASKDAEPAGYREGPAAVRAPSNRVMKLAEAPLPPWAQRMLPTIGGGATHKTYLLRQDLAYVVFVEADLTDVSDYVTVLFRMEERAPAFVARPLPIDDGRRVPNTGLLFREDREFSAEFLVEVPAGVNPTAVREFLAENVRDELMGLPDVWLRTEGTIGSVTRFGQFDVTKTDELVELADALFADLGAQGGPSLLEPDGVIVKKKKKASAAAYAPA